MNIALSITSIFLLGLVFVPHAFASTTIEVSNNSGGSSNSVNVHNSTSSNSNSGSGTTKTTIIIDGKTVVDDTKDSANSETNISVHKNGDAEPTVSYEVKNVSPTAVSTEEIKKEVKQKQEEIRKEVEQKKAEAEKKMKDAVAKKEIKKETFMENLFSKIFSIFSN